MKNVVPDSVVRPLRPEPAAPRAAVPAREPSGKFDAMIDNAPVEKARPVRPDRAPTAGRRNDAAPKARGETRADARPSRDGEPPRKAERNSTNSTKPADAPTTRQAKNGQPSDQAAPDAEAPVAQEVPAVPAQPAAVQTVTDLAAAVDAALAQAGDVVEAASQSDDDTAGTDDTATGDAAVALANPDAKPAEIAVAAPVVVAVQAPADPAPSPVPAATADTDLTADIAPVDAGAKNPAPVPPSDEAQPVPAAPEMAAAPEKSVAPKQAADTGLDPALAAKADTKEPAAVAPPVLPKEPSEKADAKTATDSKTDSVKAKPGEPVHTAHAQPDARPAAAPVHSAASVEAPEPQARPAHLPHAQTAEAAPARGAPAEARAENAATALSTPPPAPAPVAGAPIMPFNLAISPSLAAHTPLSAFRAEPGSTPVPIEGVAVEIVSRAEGGQRRFDIRLDPPELGRIEVRLDVDTGGKVTSRLVVDRADTLDLLRRDAPQLERALQHAGLNTEGGLQFSLRDQGFAQRDQLAREGANVSHLIVPEDDTAAAEAARRGYGRLIGLGGGVDIRV